MPAFLSSESKTRGAVSRLVALASRMKADMAEFHQIRLDMENGVIDFDTYLPVGQNGECTLAGLGHIIPSNLNNNIKDMDDTFMNPQLQYPILISYLSSK